MAPHKPIDKRIQTIIDFATQAHQTLQDRSAVPARQDLDGYIKLLPSLGAGASGRILDRLGAELWNVATGILSEDENEASDLIRVGVRVRVFALLLLDAALRASQRRSKDRDEVIRILKTAIRAARLCLEKNELDLALVALETCAYHLPPAAETQPVMQISNVDRSSLGDRDQILHDLSGQSFLLRLHHAWKSKRVDLADHFFSKVDLSSNPTTFLALKAADLFDEISKSLSLSNRHKEALVWSQRAFAALISLEPESLTPEAAELLLSVGVSLGTLLSSVP